VAAAVAAVVALAALAGWTAHLTNRVRVAEGMQADTAGVLATVSHPDSRVVPVETAAVDRIGQLAAAFVPGRTQLFVFGSMRPPQSDRVYHAWLLRGSRYRSAAVFLPIRGAVLIRIGADPTTYDGLLITEERDGAVAPSSRRIGTASFTSV
jgi:hypothetical protein